MCCTLRSGQEYRNRLYKDYLNHCPEDQKCSAFYQTPLKKLKGSLWYGVTPVGHDTLA